MKNKKSIAAIVAIGMLLIVTVTAGITFDGWYTKFTSSNLAQIEEHNVLGDQIKTDTMINSILYLSSNGVQNVTELKVVTGNGIEKCSFGGSTTINSTGLVGWWKLNDETSVIYDYSGNANNGTLYGDTRLLFDFNDGTVTDKASREHSITVKNGVNCTVSGINGNGCEFDGIDDEIVISGIDIDSRWTYSVWFKPYSTSPTGPAGLIGAINNPRLTWSWSSSNYAIESLIKWSEAPGYLKVVSENNLSLNKWYHTLVTVDTIKKEMKLYLDGVMIRTRTWSNGTITNPPETHYINNRDGQHSFNGSIDEVAIYSRALSGVEVKNLYDAKKAKFIEFKETNLDKGIEFGGNESGIFVDLGNSSVLNPTEFSIVALHKLRQTSIDYDYNYLYSNTRDNSSGTNYSGIDFKVYAENNLTMKIWDGFSSTDTVVFDSNLELNKNHISISTFNGSHLQLFDNGDLNIPKLTTATVGQPASNSTLIGAMGYDPNKFNYDGIIEEVRLYNRTLSNDEMNQLHWYSIKPNEIGMNEIDLSSCNLNQGTPYKIIVTTNDKVLEKTIMNL